MQGIKTTHAPHSGFVHQARKLITYALSQQQFATQPTVWVSSTKMLLRPRALRPNGKAFCEIIVSCDWKAPQQTINFHRASSEVAKLAFGRARRTKFFFRFQRETLRRPPQLEFRPKRDRKFILILLWRWESILEVIVCRFRMWTVYHLSQETVYIGLW